MNMFQFMGTSGDVIAETGLDVTLDFFVFNQMFRKTVERQKIPIAWVWPPPSNSDHQDYYIFSSRGIL